MVNKDLYNKSRIVQRFAQLLTLTTCLSEKVNWKTCQSPRQPDYKQFYITQHKVSYYSTLLETAEVQSDQSLMAGQIRQISGNRPTQKNTPTNTQKPTDRTDYNTPRRSFASAQCNESKRLKRTLPEAI